MQLSAHHPFSRDASLERRLVCRLLHSSCVLARRWHFKQKSQHASCRRRPTFITCRGISPYSSCVSTKQRTATPSNCWQTQVFISGNSRFTSSEVAVIYYTYFSGEAKRHAARLYSHHIQDYAISGPARSILHARSQCSNCCFLTIQARHTRLADNLVVGNHPCI